MRLFMKIYINGQPAKKINGLAGCFASCGGGGNHRGLIIDSISASQLI